MLIYVVCRAGLPSSCATLKPLSIIPRGKLQATEQQKTAKETMSPDL
jgi:hypothetical protein